MGRLRAHVRSSLGPLAESFRNPGVRRLQLAFVGSLLGTWSYIIALFVYAYAHGGATAVGIVGVVRMVPAGILSPFAATLVDRFPRRLMMIASDFARMGFMGAAAAVIAGGGPAWLVYTLVGCTSVSGTVFPPAQKALLPTLARTPAELTAANVSASTLDAVATFAGPAIGGFVLAATNAETVFALNAASYVWSALLVLGIRVEEPLARRRHEAHAADRRMTAGFRAIFGDRRLSLLVGLYTAQTLVAGALSVLVVVTALKLLDRGSSTVGLLSAALGVGGLIGGFLVLLLATRGRLATDFAIGLALYGAPLALIAGVPDIAVALLAMGIVGLGNSIVDVSAITLLQRSVRDEVLGRVLGVMYGVLLGSLGVGALLAPPLIHAIGARGAILVVGAILPTLALLAAPALRRLDAEAPAPALVSLLRGVDIFQPLPPATVERLASELVEVRLPAGATVIRQGDVGDRFYVIGEGEVEIEGQTFGPGASFGEIALLRDVPRTATVTARTDVVLHALERDAFIAAVTGHESSASAADAVIARRLGELRSEVAEEATGLTTEPGPA